MFVASGRYLKILPVRSVSNFNVHKSPIFCRRRPPTEQLARSESTFVRDRFHTGNRPAQLAEIARSIQLLSRCLQTEAEQFLLSLGQLRLELLFAHFPQFFRFGHDPTLFWSEISIERLRGERMAVNEIATQSTGEPGLLSFVSIKFPVYVPRVGL